MCGSRPRFGQSSDLTSDCRSDQLVKAGRRPYFASRRYSVDRALTMVLTVLIGSLASFA
jgi:hypothetical protein